MPGETLFVLDESCDPRVEQYTNYVVCMQRLDFPEEDFGDEDDALGRLGRDLVVLASTLERCYREQSHLLDVTERVNQASLSTK